MIVRVDTKNWLGNYHSNVIHVNSDKHLENYLNVIRAKNTSKLIGYEILQD